ncbi:outer membrane protein assembly factor BamD [Pelagibacterales bacterium SAG-MED20]|nr:outer membrane protein assembly factor BamD [Pelagibacterales bacterium SAG-MED20]
MNNIYKFLLIIILLTSCAKDNEEKSLIKETDQELEMINAYKLGYEFLNKGDFFYSGKKFLEAELLYPQSDWAPKAALMASYAYYLQDNYTDAKSNLERYIKTYPRDKRLVYGHFLLAMCYYETIEDEKKDLAPLLIAKNKFNFIITNFPDTDFAIDSRFKVDLIDDILASKEMYIGRHYLKREKWIPAINRFKNVLKEHETSVYTEEAIHRLVELYYHVGLEDEAKKYAALLGYNYESSKWYKKTYKIFNKKYDDRTIKEIKKEKKSVIKKFKKLFE